MSRNVDGWNTAIVRKHAPKPIRWLDKNKLLIGSVLDYGCGRQTFLGMDGYDPHWHPDGIRREQYDTIVCCYVLNVLDEFRRPRAMTAMRTLLAPGGSMFLIVRRDVRRDGQLGKGKTWQYYIEMNLPKLIDNSCYAIYRYTKG